MDHTLCLKNYKNNFKKKTLKFDGKTIGRQRKKMPQIILKF